MPFKLPILLNFQGSAHLWGVGSFSYKEISSSIIDLGVTTFVEIGPGKTLAGFIKKTDKDLTVINVEKIEDLGKLTATV